MANEDNKDLSIEEMRNAVLLASVMPNIEEAFTILRSNLAKQTASYTNFAATFNDYAKQVTELSTRVEKLIGEMATIEKLQKQVGELEAKVKSLEGENKLLKNSGNVVSAAAPAVKEEKKAEPKQDAKKEVKASKEKKDEPKDSPKSANKIIEMIYAEQKGRKSRRLTIENIIGIGKCDMDTAKEVIGILKKTKKYNDKTQMLTF